MKKFLKQLHLWLSVPLGILITLICLSGASLAFEKEITQAMHPELYKTEYTEGAPMLAPSVLARHITAQLPDTLQLSSLQLPGKPDGVCIAGFTNAGRKTLSVNPYTGAVNGWIESNSFFSTMRKLHRWMLDPPAKKGAPSVGKYIVGISTLLMGIILISGLVIWIPRTQKGLKNRLRVCCSKGWRRFWYDSHVSLGIYALPFLLLMVLTGLTWSFSWYRTGVYALFGASDKRMAQKNPQDKQQPDKKERKSQSADFTAWDKAMAQLKRSHTAYQKIEFKDNEAKVGLEDGASVTFSIIPHTGELHEAAKKGKEGQPVNMKRLIYSLHTGSWGGMTTRILYFLAALIGGILPLTGYYLWIRRTLRKKKTPHAGVPPVLPD